MDAPFFFVPGQQIMPFTVNRKDNVGTKGRVVYDTIEIGTTTGTISDASQREKHEWNQMNHPITHTIVIRGTCDVIAEDILMDAKSQNYHVQGVSDPSNLGFFTIVFCKRVRWSNGIRNRDEEA